MNYKIIDTEYLNEISKNKAFIKKMIALFKNNILEFQTEMPKAIKKKDFKKLSALAHKAKSSVMIFGMNGDAEKMKVLENLAKRNINIETFNKRVGDFIENCNQALQEINNLEKELDN